MRYFVVNTKDDGYHTSAVTELEIDNFYVKLGHAFERLSFVSASYNSNGVTWLQFLFHEEENLGLGFFYYK